jgi:hypothetical protein
MAASMYGGPSHVTIELNDGRVLDFEAAMVDLSIDYGLDRTLFYRGAPYPLRATRATYEVTVRSYGPVTLFEGTEQLIEDVLDDDEFKCDYCGQVNPITNYHCRHCGGPRPLKYQLRERRNEVS